MMNSTVHAKVFIGAMQNVFIPAKHASDLETVRLAWMVQIELSTNQANASACLNFMNKTRFVNFATNFVVVVPPMTLA